jgi:hypothetical protein
MVTRVFSFEPVLGGYHIFDTHQIQFYEKITKGFKFSLFNYNKKLYNGSGYQYFYKFLKISSHDVSSHKFENSQLLFDDKIKIYKHIIDFSKLLILFYF